MARLGGGATASQSELADSAWHMVAVEPTAGTRLARTYRAFQDLDRKAPGAFRNPSFLTTQFFPRSVQTPDHLRALRPTFEALNRYVFEEGCAGRAVPSYLALEHVVVGLQELGYEVEHQPTSVTGREKKQKVGVPVLFGPDDIALSYTQKLWMGLKTKAAYLPG